MPYRSNPLSRFQDHLLQPTREQMEARLKRFRLASEVIEDLSPLTICDIRRALKIRPAREWIEIEPPIPDPEFERPWDRYMHRLVPESLDDLKEWIGLPNRVIERNRARARTREVFTHHLPAVKSFRFDALDLEQRDAVHNMAFNLLYSYVDMERIQRPPLSGVVDYMLERSKDLPLLVIPDLIVCAGESVTFQNFATLFFNNVLVEGSGQITPGTYTKLHAYQVKHI